MPERASAGTTPGTVASVSTDRALVVHGHFYQPPRENPWTEEVAREPSAAPFHDWNARITAECYRPNTAARIVDERGAVVGIVDNYEHLSFNVGPTLLSWLERHRPEVYAAMVGDGTKRDGAIAQAYGHLILPLCNERDMRTQIRWGLADFRHRFGRPSEGMWLPECAVNDAVLAVLAEEGVGFTILAPNQAATDGPVDTRQPYRWEHPDGDGKGVDLIFYDGPLSHAIAFELPSLSSQRLVERAVAAAGDEGGLVTIASDGESFGHHHTYGDRLLAHALAVEAPARGMRVTSAAGYLRDHPPTERVQVQESSWSCAHGVARWREDCGCHTGGQPGWTQRWRTPLRHALDLLRDRAIDVFERRGPGVLRDPWAARDAYVDVLIGAVDVDAFAAEHVVGDRVEALTMLECQRHAMAMYTSCGWFFNDLAGLETVQVLRYAARTMDLIAELGDDPGEEAFLAVLEQAHSNDPAEGSGRDIWQRHVVPARVDAERVVAHLALVELLGAEPMAGRSGAYLVDAGDHTHDDRGALALSAGRVTLTHARTGRRSSHVYAALHLGALEVTGVTRPADAARDDEALEGIRRAFEDGLPVTALLRRMGEDFGSREFDLSWALPDAAEQIVEQTAAALADRLAGAYERIYEDHRRTLVALTVAGYPLPPELRAPAELALARRFEQEVAAQAGSPDPAAYRSAVAIAREAKVHGFRIDTPRARATIERLLLDAVRDAVRGDADSDRAVERALALLNLAHDLELHPDIERPQELVYDALERHPSPALRLLAASLGLAQ